ncbi:MAG: L-2-amino-thiazoline-4-carboxylic acid hydrolase [Gemmatimonadota bacterium]|nr:MAG: L-2-amino-thiazoline-4-carboxylic acid hydrolase [Gemmatimonadota bacterium]
MRTGETSYRHTRRNFLFKSVSALPLLYAGCKGAVAETLFHQDSKPEEEHKFQKDSGMSYERVFNFAFKSWYIRYMKGLEGEIGKDRFLEMLREVGSKIYSDSVRSQFQDVQNRDVDALITHFWIPMTKSQFWSSAMTIEIVQKAGASGIVAMTECLVAKTFREAEAADIGYSAICHADYTVARTFNPKIVLTRNTCLMRGDDSCYFDYSLQS